jgi:hypothetical protein
VTTSSIENATYGGANAVDGNTATRWSSAFADPQWIRVDLGASYRVTRTVLRWEAAFGRAYQIQFSEDGATWQPAAFSTTTGDGGVDDVAVTGSGRYVRINMTQRATPWGYSLWNLEVFGNCPTPTNPPTTTTTTTTTQPPTTTVPPQPFSATRFLVAGGGLPGTSGTAGSVSVAAANGNWIGTPHLQSTFTATGLTATFSGGATAYDLFVDSGSGVGNGIQVRVSYDFTGNGSFDRVETFNYFATDPVAGYEHYTQSSGFHSSSGTFANLAGGTVRVEVWNAIGSTPVTLGTGNQSRVVVPFS